MGFKQLLAPAMLIGVAQEMIINGWNFFLNDLIPQNLPTASLRSVELWRNTERFQRTSQFCVSVRMWF